MITDPLHSAAEDRWDLCNSVQLIVVFDKLWGDGESDAVGINQQDSHHDETQIIQDGAGERGRH